MEFRIADTFTDSLARLTGDEQKSVKTTAFDLQLNPANPGMSFHRLEKARDRNFWSVRCGSDLRLIVHKDASSFLLCYVDHHDRAYDWAERRKLETHPKTGAAQLVEIRETVKEVFVPLYVEVESPKQTASFTAEKPLFSKATDEELLSFGVPLDWLGDVKNVTESSLLALTDHLPAEAAEALLELATGGKPSPQPDVDPSDDPFEHPDAQRRFRVMTNVEELESALEYPWDKWTVFLHPEQRQWVARDYNGPARVSGSAGTGKTIVALHRAAHLARTNSDARVLLTTFSDTLAHALQTKLKRLLSSEPRIGERIDVYSLAAIGSRLYNSHAGQLVLASRDTVCQLIRNAAAEADGHRFSNQFLITEWNQVVDAWQLTSWEAYRDVARLGRRTRLPEAQRATLWSIFEKVRSTLRHHVCMTESEMFTILADKLGGANKPIFDFVVVDEAQDTSIAQLRFLAALGGGRPNALFFAGDLGQRIFQQPFSWKSLGVDIRGRSRTLRVNYRTSHQIRSQADRLLGPEVSDADGNVEERTHTVSFFNGPPPRIQQFKNEKEECQAVGQWIAQQTESGLTAHEFGVFVRSADQLDRARAAVETSGLPYKVLDQHVATASGHVSIATMDLAKGLEFRVVVVMACDDEVLPLQERIESVGDEADLEEVYNSERHLLYVACTRARDQLLVTSVFPASEFLDDMNAA
jgi:mRNA-degrading endonuclease RelE of RelBE toxin-antitoxin system